VRRLAVLALVAVACGRSPFTLEVDPTDGGSAPASDADSTSDAAAANGPCTAGANQTCNDDPSQSSFAGMCLGGKGSASFCVCDRGFALNPATGRCRVSACVSAATDPWDATVPLPIDDCDRRVISVCTLLDVSADGQLAFELDAVARKICSLPDRVFVRVETVNGCATELRVRASGVPLPAGLVPCLQKELRGRRWECGRPSGCALVEHDTLP
jgi:hypothetical protein